MKKKIVSLLLCVTMSMSLLAGCNSNSSDTTITTNADTKSDTTSAESGDEESGSSKYEKFITVDVFDNLANYQGVQSGWFADVVKEKFNMELNLISPNVAGGGDTLYNTRTAAGDLGDLIIVGSEDGRAQELVTADLLLDMTEMLENTEYVKEYTAGIDNLASLIKEDGVYGIPTNVSSRSATEPSNGSEPTFGPYVRWDLYAELGYPEMNNLDDLLDVLEAMQELCPTSDSGQTTYALSLFKDWDGNMLCLAKQPTCYFGFDELGFVLAKADGSDYQSIIESDSIYVEVLEFFNKAYQRGILDPESSTQTYDTLYDKYKDGAVLFSFWPWLGQAAYNTTEHTDEGKGFALATIDGMTIFEDGATPEGEKTFIAIGKNAEDPERLMDFIDWLYSPEGICYTAADTQSGCGPEGLTWEMVDGQPVLTEFGVQAFVEGTGTVPDEWGGGDYHDGQSKLNFAAVNTNDINPETGGSYNYTLWDSYIEDYGSTPLSEDWTEKTGYLSTMDYLVDNDLLLVAPGNGYVAPEEDQEIKTLRGQCKEIIVANSWQMVYASDAASFNSILEDMQTRVIGLGYEKVLEVDMQNAQDQNDARVAAAAAAE